MRAAGTLALLLALALIITACGAASPAVQWPSESLPEDFPVLEGANEVRDGTQYGGYLEIVWNNIPKERADELASVINGWLSGEYDEKIIYDDTLKYYSDGSKSSADGSEAVHIGFTLLPDGEQYNLTLKLSGKL